ncbi:MAG: hypothetical protein K5750_01980 [Eubacterium sp.]|nr:hypothetical protein [Eubacterium sp.]
MNRVNSKNNRGAGAALTLLSILALVWIVGSIVFMVYSGKTGKIWLLLIVLGQFFLVMGLIAMFAVLRSTQKDLWIDLIFIVAGLGCLYYGFMAKFADDFKYSKMVDFVPTLMGIVFLCVGCLILMVEATNRNDLKKNCTYEVIGKCVGRDLRGGGRRLAYSPVYEVEYDGVYYTLNKNVFSRVDIPQENEERKLFVDRADLEKLRNEEGERKIDRYIDEGPDAANFKLALTIWGLIALAGVGIIIARMIVG